MAPHSTAGISRAVRWGDYHQWAPSPFGTLIVDMLERPGHLVSPAFRNDATTRCSEPVHSLRKSIFLTSVTAPADVAGLRWMAAGAGFAPTNLPTANKLNMASIDGRTWRNACSVWRLNAKKRHRSALGDPRPTNSTGNSVSYPVHRSVARARS